MKKIATFRQQATNYEIETRIVNDKKTLIVPVVMMREGVHNGSSGHLLHTAYELGKVLPSWNGIPVVIQHPQDEQGNYISANVDTMVENIVGRIYNAHMDGDKLKAECWIEESKINSLSPETLAYIRSKRALDVSVGVFSDNQENEGDWNNEHYTAIATNLRPDHLALLPNETGACSWADGCGIRVNKEKELDMSKEKENKEFVVNTDLLKALNKDGYSVNLIANEQGMREKIEKISRKIDSLDNDMRVYYLDEVFESYIVYRVSNRQSDEIKLYKQNYTIDQAGNVTLDGDPVEVKKEVTYQTLSEVNNLNNNKEEKKMSKKVDELIANSLNAFTECDRSWLVTLNDAQLEKLTPMVNKEAKEEKQEISLDTAKGIVANSLKSEEDVLGIIPEGLKGQFEEGIKAYKAQREASIESILANSKEFEKEELEAMNVNMLTKIAKAVAKEQSQVQDFSLNTAGGKFENGKIEIKPLGEE